jgi:hypothetical protein
MWSKQHNGKVSCYRPGARKRAPGIGLAATGKLQRAIAVLLHDSREEDTSSQVKVE